MIFLTVGTQFSFDRLVQAVDQAVCAGKITEQICAQIGNSLYQPTNFAAVASMKKSVFDEHILRASCIISHAGMGTIAMALNNNKPLLVMPRQKKYGEVVNDHQIAIARKFEEFGHILAAYSNEDLQAKIKQLKSFVPMPRTNNTKEIINKISEFLSCLNQSV
jgi:UDP-N-acetylglucosamine transferase subunit ALG13